MKQLLSRWVGQVIGHLRSPLFGRHSRSTQHAFKDVAVVAQDASRLLRVVAMIGADAVRSAKSTLTYSAQAALVLKSCFKKFCAKSGSVFPLQGEFFRPYFRIFGHACFVAKFRSSFTLWSLCAFSSLRGYFVFSVMCTATRFNFWPLVVRPGLFASLFDICQAAKSNMFKVGGPFIRGAFGFLLAGSARLDHNFLRSVSIRVV